MHGRKIPFSQTLLTKMSALTRIVQLLEDKVSQQPSNYLSTTAVYEEEVVSHLLEMLNSILTSDSYTHGYKTTLDYSTPDSKLDGCEIDSGDPIHDPD